MSQSFRKWNCKIKTFTKLCVDSRNSPTDGSIVMNFWSVRGFFPQMKALSWFLDQFADFPPQIWKHCHDFLTTPSLCRQWPRRPQSGWERACWARVRVCQESCSPRLPGMSPSVTINSYSHLQYFYSPHAYTYLSKCWEKIVGRKKNKNFGRLKDHTGFSDWLVEGESTIFIFILLWWGCEDCFILTACWAGTV